MMDLSPTIVAKSDQLNADDLLSGPRTITVTRVSADPSSSEQPVTIYYEGDQGRPFKPCKSMRRVMVAVWGADGGAYAGRSMTLYRDPSVRFGGMQVGGIRISHMTGLDSEQTLALAVTRGKKAPYKVKPLRLDSSPQGGLDAASLGRDGEAAAGDGMDALKAWWGTLPNGARSVMRGEMDRLKRLASDVDTQRESPSGDDPFHREGQLTPEQAAEEAAAEAAVREQEQRDREGGE